MKLVRHYRPEEALADTIKPVIRGNRDSQRATGTEKAQTMLVAEQAATTAAQAVVLADGKLTVSGRLPEASDGADKPAGALWMTKNMVGALESQWEWDGSDWTEVPLSREIIPMISTAMLEADAINGMTIIGAIIRTAASGQRMQLDINGLSAYDAAGTLVARLASSAEGITIGTPFSTPLGRLTGDGITFVSSAGSSPDRSSFYGRLSCSVANNLRFANARVEPEQMYVQRFRKQTGFSDGLEAVGADVSSNSASFMVEHRDPGAASSAVAQLRAFTDASEGQTSEARADVVIAGRRVVSPVVAGDVLRTSTGSARYQLDSTGLRYFNASNAEVARVTVDSNGNFVLPAKTVQLADIPWTMAAASGSPTDRAGLRNGWTNNINALWNGLQSRRLLGVSYLTGAVWKTTSYASLEVIAILPPLLAPDVPTMLPAAYGTSGGYVLVKANGEIVTSQAGTSGQIAITGALVPPQ